MAADALAGHDFSEHEARSKIEGFLGMLGYRSSNDAFDRDDDTLNNRTLLLRAAARLGGIFRLHSRNAPGLTFFGGNAAPPTHASSRELSASLNGAGETPRAAFEACIGEGVEYLSQFRHADDAPRTGTFDDVAPWNDMRLAERLIDWMDEPAGKSAPIGWIAAKRLPDGEPGWLPAALVLRYPDSALRHQQRFALSSGCAAGPTWAAAVTSALLEVVERDAVAMWWRGGRAGRPIALETLAETGVNALVGRIRQGTEGRVTTLIDISGDFDIPCVAAMSLDRDGSGFAGGFACRLNAERACKAAIIEMCQMELGNDVVAAKRSRLGADGLNEADRRQEGRKAGILASQPHLIDGLAGTISLRSREADSLPEALARLAASGFHAYAVDLTRPEFGIPVARVVIPGLQPYPSAFTSPRLAAALAAASHKSPYANGVDLF